MAAKFVINDGQHRRAGIEAALRECPELGEETIAVVFFLDVGLERCQQMFADLNRYAIRPTTSLSILYDHRDDDGIVTKALLQRVQIFKDLTEKQRSWRIYRHDIPQSATLARIWSELPDHLYLFEGDFMADAMAGRLPNYSFIEPRYFTDLFLNNIPNDQHPPHNVLCGEQLIAAVYNAVRNSPVWKKSLLVITYDEHGGCFDHMPPPAAVSKTTDSVCLSTGGFTL